MRWWNGQSETTRRLGSGLAVCGTVVGALYVIVQTGPSDRAMQFIDDTGRIAINRTQPTQQFAMNLLQSAVDASPTKPLMSVPIPQPSPLGRRGQKQCSGKALRISRRRRENEGCSFR
jgi:hypothetical protein